MVLGYVRVICRYNAAVPSRAIYARISDLVPRRNNQTNAPICVVPVRVTQSRYSYTVSLGPSINRTVLALYKPV